MLIQFLKVAEKFGFIGCLVTACICFLICFPIMLEQITIRVGKQYILLATGNVYFLSQALAAVFAQVFGIILSDKSRESSEMAIRMGMGIMALSLMLSMYAGLRSKSPFLADVIVDSTNESKYDNKLNHSLGTIAEAADESLY